LYRAHGSSLKGDIRSQSSTVAVVDLDLEAPGLGTLLGVETRRGVLDFVVDHFAADSQDLVDMSGPPTVFGDAANSVQVFPAGRLDARYLDKLARLDFAASGGWAQPGPTPSPAGAALQALLLAIGRQQPRPEYILLDSRAGLHDLAGLSLHGLAHVDVLFSRASGQGYEGLDLAITTLARQHDDANRRWVIVHAQAPLRGTPEAVQEEEEFRTRTYQMFVERVYAGENVPQMEVEGLHTPHVLHFNQELTRFVSLADRREALFREDYVSLLSRVEELCEEEDEADNA
jgi:hypothetical protein